MDFKKLEQGAEQQATKITMIVMLLSIIVITVIVTTAGIC